MVEHKHVGRPGSDSPIPQQHRTGGKGEGLEGGKGKGKEWKGEVANINRVSTMNENFPVLTLSRTTVTPKSHCFCLN